MGSFVELVLQAILVAGTTAIFALIGWVPVMVVSGARDQSGCAAASLTSVHHARLVAIPRSLRAIRIAGPRHARHPAVHHYTLPFALHCIIASYLTHVQYL